MAIFNAVRKRLIMVAIVAIVIAVLIYIAI